MDLDEQFPMKLIGQISWFGGPNNEIIGPTPVKRAFRRSHTQLVLGCEIYGYKYDISLTSVDGLRFTGNFAGTRGYKKLTADADAKLFSNAEGYLLWGQWREEDGEFIWCAELHPVKVFPDEGK